MNRTRSFAILTFFVFSFIFTANIFAVNPANLSPAAPCQSVSIPTINTLRNTALSVPLNVDDVTGNNILSYDLTITYNSAVLTYLGTDKTGTLSSAMNITVNDTAPGTLIISGYDHDPLASAGTLLKLNFFVTGAIGSSSPVSFGAFMFNEGTPCSAALSGSVNVISGTINGAVTYANSLTTKPVPNTVLNAMGSVNRSANSAFLTGAYSLNGMGSGAYTVTPSKATDVTSITAFDSGLIAQHVVELITLNPAQAAAADVSESSGITSFDAALIARYVALLPGFGSTGTWKFNPVSRTYSNVEANQSSQDYSATLMGEVSGDWTPPTMLAPFADKNEAAPEAIVNVTAPTINVQVGSPSFDIPVTVSDTTGQGIISYQFNLIFDPAVIQPLASPVDVTGTVSDGMLVTTNLIAPNTLRVVAFTATPRVGSGTLLKFKFAAVGPLFSFSPLTWQDFMFNEGTPGSATVNGRVNLVHIPTAASVTVAGRVLSAAGQPIGNATVILVTNDNVFEVKSSPLGYYQFDNVPAGQNYVLQAKAKQHSFAPLLVSVADPTLNLDLFANE
jgi:hypothetical protein